MGLEGLPFRCEVYYVGVEGCVLFDMSVHLNPS